MWWKRTQDFEETQQAKKAKNNPTTITLDIFDISNWSREEILLLFNAPISQRGANFSKDKIQLIQSICSHDLISIVENLQTRQQSAAVDILYESIGKSKSMCQAIVQWLQPKDIKGLATADFNYLWISKLLLGMEVQWPTVLGKELKEEIENWLKSLRYFNIQIFADGVPFSERVVGSQGTFNVLQHVGSWGKRAPPFINRNEAIIETMKCLDTFFVPKPIYPIISTSMGMGKTSFLLSAPRKFLQDPSLLYEYIFEKKNEDEITWDSLRELIEKERNNCPRVEFVNRLYITINNGHFIAIEPVTAFNDEPMKILENAITSYFKKMFVGALVRIDSHSIPIKIDSLEQLFIENDSMVTRLKMFSQLIKWNAPDYDNELFPTTKDTTNDELPLLIYLDSFHLMNFDVSRNGSLYKTCTIITEWKNDIPGLSLILSTNSLPNQFTSEEKTLFFFKSIHLELLIGTDTFREIIYELYGVYLNSSVLEETIKETMKSVPTDEELSPYLTRVLLSLLYMCSGNGRAIERLYFNCNKLIESLIETDLSITYNERMKLTHNKEYHNIWQDGKNVVKQFALHYQEHYITNSGKELLLKQIMGVNAKPDCLIGEYTIEHLQKVGLFVKFGVDDINGKCKYGGSFMMINNKGIITELDPISPDESTNYTHLAIESQWLLQPYNCISTMPVKKQGDYFELTIASSIWARYCIACLESGTIIGSSISISKVLPSCMITSLFSKATISLKGVVKLTAKFQLDSAISILPKSRVIINLDQAKFSDIILPIKVGNETRYIGMQSKYLSKESASQQNPFSFIDNAKNVLSFDEFAYVIFPYLSKMQTSFPYNPNHDNLQEIVTKKERVIFATCEDLVSVWFEMTANSKCYVRGL